MEHYKRSHHLVCYGERVSPSKHLSMSRYSYHHSPTRSRAVQDRSLYHHSHSERAWLREKHYPEKMPQDRSRYYPDRYTPYAVREPSMTRPHKDSSRARKGWEQIPVREQTHLHSPHTGAAAPFPLHQKHYPQEKVAFGADHNGGLSDRLHEHESVKSCKRRYESTESRDSHLEKKAHRSLPRDLDEPKVKSRKKSKKKKKSKDKHQELGYRYRLDPCVLVVYSDADLCRHKKKKKKKRRRSGKSEDSVKEPRLYLLKVLRYETVNHFWRPEGSFLFANGLAVEVNSLFQKKTKHLRMESRADRCHPVEYGQGKRRFFELRREKLLISFSGNGNSHMEMEP
ncbi:PREDICTED: ubiquitin carboxyl-terminal hydrolase 42-like [Chinchilla lanigera]|uniref:ubiquitin carboxyl-terminal hydrolase 42-like n=1 Tax=Chinchilla lanigera TaxID=34839 RepID=UPI0006975ABC|nr:PREDICTED: ubiquitin carboxyl-terminal hydrolase 42-like [Chinchilla lanigera]